MLFVPIIAAVAAVLAFLVSVFNSFLLMSVVKTLLMLFSVAVGALLLFTLFALIKKYFFKKEEVQRDVQEDRQ